MAGSGEGERDDGADIAVASASGRVGWFEWCCKIAALRSAAARPPAARPLPPPPAPPIPLSTQARKAFLSLPVISSGVVQCLPYRVPYRLSFENTP